MDQSSKVGSRAPRAPAHWSRKVSITGQFVTSATHAGLFNSSMELCTQSFVVSFWRVEDQSTADLMVHFYEALRSGESVSRALRSAQLALLQTHHHPYYWAPFVLTDNPMLQITNA